MKCVENFHDFDLYIVVSMNPLARENTMAQVIVAANAIGTLLNLFPKMAQKLGDLVVYMYTNFKDVVTLAFIVIGVVVFLFAANHYIENEYHIKARLSRFLEPSTGIKEF